MSISIGDVEITIRLDARKKPEASNSNVFKFGKYSLEIDDLYRYF